MQSSYHTTGALVTIGLYPRISLLSGKVNIPLVISSRSETRVDLGLLPYVVHSVVLWLFPELT
jgi:hypothetical protein